MALENRGLVHNDLKPENMLMMADGTVKIMDFGESQFGDESGETPSFKSAQGSKDEFSVTPAYVAPEQFDRGRDKVTSKVDAFALGHVIQDLGSRDMSSARGEGVSGDEKPATARSRLTTGLLSDNPDERPSLQAVLTSSYMRSGRSDYHPEDVEDLKSAAADFNAHLSGLKVAAANGGDDEPVADIQKRINGLKSSIQKKQKDMVGKSAPEVKQLEAEISDLSQKISGWQKRTAGAMKARHDKGEEDYQKLIDDESNTITVGSKTKKTQRKVSVKKALAAKQRYLKEIEKIQNDFYNDTNFDPDKLDETNQELMALDKKVKQIDARVAKLLGPDAKFYLAEKKLSEVAERFGPKTLKPDARADEDDVEDADEDDVEDDVDPEEDDLDAPPPRSPSPPPPKTKTT